MGGPLPNRILLAHGGGGLLTDTLVREAIHARLANEWLDPLDDSAVLPRPSGDLAFTTDSYVVQPLSFPGGDIGRLAVSGTVNDLAACGAAPRWLSLGLVLEEGLPTATLLEVLDSAAATAREAGVAVVAGDTKVVARGEADGMYVNTAGIGVFGDGPRPSLGRVRPGDRILLSGPVADHGLAVMLAREALGAFDSELASDVAPLGGLVAELLRCVPEVAFLRDPTRGGLAGVAADLAAGTGHRVELLEERIPVRKGTRYVAEMLGLDPLTVANEGKMVVVVRPDRAAAALEALRGHPRGREAAEIGTVGGARDGTVVLKTAAGGTRLVQKPYGEELPRIC
jgi:hydrogenase expression/formation protein HypE